MDDFLMQILEFIRRGEMKKKTIKYVREGEYVAEVDVDLIVTDDEWSPYLSFEDAYKLDDVRCALRDGDLKMASTLGRVFKLTPVPV